MAMTREEEEEEEEADMEVKVSRGFIYYISNCHQCTV